MGAILEPIIVKIAGWLFSIGIYEESFIIAEAIVYGAVIYASVAYNQSQARKARSALSSMLDNGRLLMTRDSVAPHRLIYGQCLVSGPMAFWGLSGTKNEYLHVLPVLAAHECEELGAIQLDTTPITLDGNGDATGKYAGYLNILKFNGTAAQTSDTTMIAAFPGKWTSNHRGRERAYLHGTFKYSTDIFSGLPNLCCLVKGKKVWDPRDGAQSSSDPTTWKYSNNAALCVADYMHDSHFGKGIAWSRINTAALIEAANICDEDVVLADSSTEKRYTINGTVNSDQDPNQVLGELCAAMAGCVVPVGAAYYIRAGAYRTSSVSLTDDDVFGTLQVQTRQSRSDSYNRVKGTYICSENSWQSSDFPAVKNDTYMGWDGGVRLEKEVAYNFTTSPATGQRLAKIDLEAGRQQEVITGRFSLKMMQALPKDTVTLTNSFLGISSKLYEVINWTLKREASENTDGNQEVSGPAIYIEATLRETASTIFNWNNGEETTVDLAPNIVRWDPTVVATPTGLALTCNAGTGYLAGDGTFVPRLQVTWTVTSDIFVEKGGYVRLEYKLHTDSDWLFWSDIVGSKIKDFITDIKTGLSWDVRISFINTNGAQGSFATDTIAIGTLGTTPATPTGTTLVAGAGLMTLDWSDNSEADFDSYGLYRNTSNSFGGATRLAWCGTSRFVDTLVAFGQTYYYWITAINRAGQESSPTAEVHASPISSAVYTLAPSGSAIVGVNSITRVAADGWTTDGSAASNEAWTSGAFCSFKINPYRGAAGLTQTKFPGTVYAFDYCWMPWFIVGSSSYHAYIYESGSQITDCGAFTTETIFSITYDGANVRYFMDGVLKRTVAASTGLKLYFGGNVYVINGVISEIAFGPMGAAGVTGSNGSSVASVLLYKRAATSPAVPTGTCTFTFATGVLTGMNNGWTQAIPDTDGNPCWVINAVAVGTGSTDTIGTGEWTAPSKFVQDGAPGSPGGTPADAPTMSAGTGSPNWYLKVWRTGSVAGTVVTWQIDGSADTHTFTGTASAWIAMGAAGTILRAWQNVPGYTQSDFCEQCWNDFQ